MPIFNYSQSFPQFPQNRKNKKEKKVDVKGNIILQRLHNCYKNITNVIKYNKNVIKVE